jgi:hypothetical protein
MEKVDTRERKNTTAGRKYYALQYYAHPNIHSKWNGDKERDGIIYTIDIYYIQ